MIARPLQPDDILGATESSFGFYALLPGDEPRLCTDWPRGDLAELGGALTRSAEISADDEQAIDKLSLALLALGAGPLPDGIDWRATADALSLLYARHLKPDGVRRIRMKAARSNFYLRDRLDASIADGANIIDERRFSQPFVWDWLPLPEGELSADSSDLNVSYRAPDGKSVSVRLGLPTQIDMLGHGRCSLTSCYRAGWYAWNRPDSQEFYNHPHPVVLVFAARGELHFLDRAGCIYRVGSDEPVARIPVDAVWRARLLDARVYVSDWSEPRTLTVVNTHDWRHGKIDTGPVLITNDICQVDDRFYVIDKMQGRVFSFDEQFVPIDACMSFGKGRGRLFDPITLRVHNGNICVLSWLTGALATIRPF